MAVASAIMGIAAFNLKDLNDPLDNGSSELAAYFKQIRSRSISTTSAYRVAPVSPTEIRAGFADNCAAGSFTNDTKMSLTLPTGADLASTGWFICYSGRGLPDVNQLVTINHGAETKSVEVFLGGGVRINE